MKAAARVLKKVALAVLLAVGPGGFPGCVQDPVHGCAPDDAGGDGASADASASQDGGGGSGDAGLQDGGLPYCPDAGPVFDAGPPADASLIDAGPDAGPTCQDPPDAGPH